MRWAVLGVMMVVVGCGKGSPSGFLPSDPAAGTMPQPKGPPPAPAAFDPEDAEKTLRWIGQQYQEPRRSIQPGDKAAEKAADDQFRTVLDGLKGKSVKWKFGLDTAGKDTLDLQPLTFTTARPPAVDATYIHPRY